MFTALRSAWSAVVRHKLRSALTILGIFIGTASVVLVVALSTGASAQVSGQVDALGTNVLFVFPQPSQSSGVRGKSIGRLTESDAFAIARDAPAVKLTAPYLETRGQVLAEKKNAQTVIIGSTLDYFDIRGFAVARVGFAKSMDKAKFDADPAAARAFIERWLDSDAVSTALSEPDTHVGGWYDADKGIVTLDVSEVHTDKDAALTRAVERGEKGIYDLETGETILTGMEGNE